MPASSEEVRRRAAGVRLALFDVDGVLTDGRLYFGAHGEELKVFHSRDGYGFALLAAAGIDVGVLSGRSCPAVDARMAALGVTLVYQGCADKRAALARILQRTVRRAEEIAYLADDLPDLPVLDAVGLAAAVADAHPRVRARSHWCSQLPGGRGAARELCELVLQAQGRL